MDWKLELFAVPVSDVDRAKAFYADQVGFHVDHDHTVNADIRFVLSSHPADGGFCRHCGAELEVAVVSVITPPDGGVIGTPQTRCGACGKD